MNKTKMPFYADMHVMLNQKILIWKNDAKKPFLLVYVVFDKINKLHEHN